ncbi:unnamed protein product [Calypogeia fissa]
MIALRLAIALVLGGFTLWKYLKLHARHLPLEDTSGSSDKGDDNEEQEQIATGSPDVELADAELPGVGSVMPAAEDGTMEDATVLEPVEAYTERLVDVPINAATQTPRGIHMAHLDTTMSVASDGDQSEYEAHFSQAIGKEDKARKQANRTPDNAGKTVDKLGKKQRKQLQFNAQGEPGRGAGPAHGGTNTLLGERGDGGAVPGAAPAAPVVKGDKRRSKDAAVGSPLRK